MVEFWGFIGFVHFGGVEARVPQEQASQNGKNDRILLGMRCVARDWKFDWKHLLTLVSGQENVKDALQEGLVRPSSALPWLHDLVCLEMNYPFLEASHPQRTSEEEVANLENLGTYSGHDGSRG